MFHAVRRSFSPPLAAHALITQTCTCTLLPRDMVMLTIGTYILATVIGTLLCGI